MNRNFYDIESVDNVFTLCNFREKENIVDIFYLSDDIALIASPTFEDDIFERVRAKNPNFNGEIALYNLSYQSACEYLAKTFGLSDAFMANNPSSPSQYPSEFRLVCDTDKDYDEEKHPYLMGYNSYNYDTTMLTLFLYETFNIVTSINSRNVKAKTIQFQPPTAKQMREMNDDLFSPMFKENMPSYLTRTYDLANHCWSDTNYRDDRWRIRKNMLFSGRHLDVARLNEKQSHLALKRILGMLGFQILESDKLQGKTHINNANEFYDLIAYNVSDVVNLKELADHKLYKSNFNLKKGLLETYPELIYEQKPGAYKPNIQPDSVRRDRLYIDSSSAQLATKALCPYGHLTDIPAVSFLYPSEQKAKELGIPQVNVLEEAKQFFYKNFQQPELRAEFDRIYDYYKSIEGKNFNESNNYIQDYTGILPNPAAHWTVKSLPQTNLNLFYYNGDGSPSSCYVTFGIGGIHGAEYNKALYEHDLAVWQQNSDDIAFAKSLYPNPIDCKKAKIILMPDGREVRATKVLKSGSTMKAAYYKDISDKKPILFRQDASGEYKLNKKYRFTSADPTNHEDFTSYYPNMLIMMSAFQNEGLGYDRYHEIFMNKEKFGKLKSDKSLSKEKRDYYDIQRNGTKLVLNSATGAADATFKSNIIMNNRIISMRIIGQLFTWRIGQAQTIQGARVTSTNTDGLFTVLEATKNNDILEREAKDIGVQIEPEPTYLISKDTNNRLEMDEQTGMILNTSGGTLGCNNGPNPEKSLPHPAIIDWALAEYLIVAAFHHKGLSLEKDFDEEVGRNILLSAKEHFEPVKWLNMFQNMVSSSPGSISYIFGTTNHAPDEPIIMQHYNRAFYMKNGTSGTMHLRAAYARTITPAMKKKRAVNKEKPVQNNPMATEILTAYGVNVSQLPLNRETGIKKITNIEPEWNVRIENRSLYYLSDEELADIMDNLDYDCYLKLLRNGYEENWRNHMPEPLPEPKKKEFQEMVDILLKTNPKAAALHIDLINRPNSDNPAILSETTVTDTEKIRQVADILQNTQNTSDSPGDETDNEA